MKKPTKTYFAQTAGWILGGNRKAGDEIEATEKEAKFALLNGTIAAKQPPSKAQQKAIIAAANGAAKKPEPRKSTTRKKVADTTSTIPAVEHEPSRVAEEARGVISDSEPPQGAVDSSSEA